MHLLLEASSEHFVVHLKERESKRVRSILPVNILSLTEVAGRELLYTDELASSRHISAYEHFRSRIFVYNGYFEAKVFQALTL